ncbi:MAG: DUF2236 domain-containing protein [Ketobacter sp.]|nr:MAG: DUF2236 domain-containing protein [Ketobacter sp.]
MSEAKSPAGSSAISRAVPPKVDGQWRQLPPDSLHYNQDWYPVRRLLFSKWIDVVDGIPAENEAIRKLSDHFWEGDPLMDDVADMFRRHSGGRGRKMFEQALEQGIDTLDNPPRELVALFDQLDRVPDWISREQVDRGAVVAANVTAAGKAAGVFLNTLQTVQGGMVGAVVGATGRMQRDVLQRARESAAFWLHLPEPGGLSRYGTAFKTIVRVRLMHSQARLMLMRKWGADWIADHGNPIPNAGLVAGIPTFGIVNLMYDAMFGKQYSHQDMEDIHAFWSYIGYLLGGAEEIIPRTPEDGIRILDFALSVVPPPSQYAEELNKVSNLLLDAMLNSFSLPLLDKQVKSLLLQALHGFYFYVGGNFLGARITETSKPTWIGRAVPPMVRVLVRLSNLECWLPGRASRRERNRQQGDPFWLMLSGQFDRLAEQQKDYRQARFNAHDESRPDEMGEAWRES